MKTSKQHILISPIGEMNNDLIHLLEAEISHKFGYSTEIRPLIDNVDFAFDENRNQYNSTTILEKLETLSPSGAVKTFALTNKDLFIPILTYVYGEAQLNGRTSVISTNRLYEGISAADQEAFFLRIRKEAIHELGHTFNLRHCKDSTCIMHYSRSTKDVDKKTDNFCRYCKILLEDSFKKL